MQHAAVCLWMMLQQLKKRLPSTSYVDIHHPTTRSKCLMSQRYCCCDRMGIRLPRTRLSTACASKGTTHLSSSNSAAILLPWPAEFLTLPPTHCHICAAQHLFLFLLLLPFCIATPVYCTQRVCCVLPAVGFGTPRWSRPLAAADPAAWEQWLGQVTAAYAALVDASLTQHQQQQHINLQPLLHQLAEFVISLACSMRWANVNVDDDRLQTEVSTATRWCSEQQQPSVISVLHKFSK